MLNLIVCKILPPALALVTLAVTLLFGERTGKLRIKAIFKTLTSALFLLTALLQSPQHRYDWLMVAGLAMCAVGDVALIRRDRAWFLTGLVAFLLGHVAYTLAFNARTSMLLLPTAAIAVIGTVSIALFLYFRRHLGRMLLPVTAYVAVITLMLMSAWAVAAAEGGDGGPGVLIATAATLFYVSDITVARDRFVPGAGFANRAFGLPLYYVAQFLFAFSIGR